MVFFCHTSNHQQRNPHIKCLRSTNLLWKIFINAITLLLFLQCVDIYGKSNCQTSLVIYQPDVLVYAKYLQLASLIGSRQPVKNRFRNRREIDYDKLHEERLQRELDDLRLTGERFEFRPWRSFFRRYFRHLLPKFDKNIPRYPRGDKDNWYFFLNVTIKNETEQYYRVLETMKQFFVDMTLNITYWIKKDKFFGVDFFEVYYPVAKALKLMEENLEFLKKENDSRLDGKIEALRTKCKNWSKYKKTMMKTLNFAVNTLKLKTSSEFDYTLHTNMSAWSHELIVR